jgi:hypothetical protein
LGSGLEFLSPQNSSQAGNSETKKKSDQHKTAPNWCVLSPSAEWLSWAVTLWLNTSGVRFWNYASRSNISRKHEIVVEWFVLNGSEANGPRAQMQYSKFNWQSNSISVTEREKYQFLIWLSWGNIGWKSRKACLRRRRSLLAFDDLTFLDGSQIYVGKRERMLMIESGSKRIILHRSVIHFFKSANAAAGRESSFKCLHFLFYDGGSRW